ncbi:MAG: hypothetical protein ACYC3W_10265, partial [Candidatus Nanopelagicales bacterium]
PHLRRFARLLPRAQQIEDMGYFVVQFQKKDRSRFRSTESLRAAARAVVSVLRSYGFSRGLRRWDFFGDPRCPACRRPMRWDEEAGQWRCRRHGVVALDAAATGGWNPHLNVVVDGRYLRQDVLSRVKADLAAALGVDMVVVNYQYVAGDSDGAVAKMVHRVRYIAKPTFLRVDWDLDMAEELRGFRNTSYWGRWDRDAVWALADGAVEDAGKNLEVSLSQLVALASGVCPYDGQAIRWQSAVELWQRSAGLLWRELGGGYWVRQE